MLKATLVNNQTQRVTFWNPVHFNHKFLHSICVDSIATDPKYKDCFFCIEACSIGDNLYLPPTKYYDSKGIQTNSKEFPLDLILFCQNPS